MTSSAFEQALARGLAAHQAHRLADAEAAYRAALAIAPDDAEAQSLLGLALVHCGRPDLAVDHLRSAVAREPHQAGFRLNLAEGLAAVRDPAGALAQLLAILEFYPGHRHASARAAPLLVARADWPALQAVATAWTRAEPANAEAWRQLARAAFEQGYHRQALEAYAQVLPLVHRRAEDLAAYAGLCLHALELERAAAALAEAEATGADLPQVHARLGLLHLYYGRFAAAEAACGRCLALDPGHVAAYTTLSRVRRGRLTDDELATVAGIAQAADRPLDHRIPAAFAAAHALDAAGQFDAAFAAYTAAHELALERDRREGRAFDPAEDERRAGWLMEAAASEPAALAEAPTVPRPVFIAGMPRSGTTLVESLLGAHSRVCAGGERPAMRQILRAFLAMRAAGQVPDDRLLQDWAAAYRRDLPDLRGADVVTDKHPLNFEAAGLIAWLFPGALILNVRRNPLATGLSIYRQEFNKHWTFAHRLADIGRYYGHYARLADHWQRTLPGRFVTVQYEDLAGDFDAAAPRLLQACGLEWEPQCLAFRQSPRAIATFSAVEAREAVTVRNGRAVRYAAHLAPLIEALQAEGVDLETGRLLPGRIGARSPLVQD